MAIALFMYAVAYTQCIQAFSMTDWPVESYDPLLMSLFKSTSISVDEGEETLKKDFNLKTWIVYVCHWGWMGKTKYTFERGMVIGARKTGLCQELQRCWVFHVQQFPVYIKDGQSPASGDDQQLTKVCVAPTPFLLIIQLLVTHFN